MQTMADEEITDFLGNVVEPGQMIVYASMMGQSTRLTLGEVVSIKRNESKYNPISIKVQPMADSTGSNYRFSQWKEGKWEASAARPVTLHRTNALMVIT
jgi:hypothetical protein